MPPSNSGSSASTDEYLDSKIPGAFPDVGKLAVSTHQSLSQALYDRRAEYTRPREIRIKVGSWNVAACKGVENDIGEWFVQGKGIEESLDGVRDPSSTNGGREGVQQQEARSSKHESTVPENDEGEVPGGEEIGIYALGIQELVDLTSPTEALRPYTDPTAANRFKEAISIALPDGYCLIAEQQLVGLLLLVYASSTVAPHIKNVSTTSVGTGLMGYMGNKGGVTTRIVLGETTRLVFINSHLSAGSDKASLERRNWDASQIVSRTKFEPITDLTGVAQGTGESLGEEDFAFWFGDLNYRLEGIPGDDVRRLLTVHTKGLDSEETVTVSAEDSSIVSGSNTSPDKARDHSQRDSKIDAVPIPPELDPASLQTAISSLLPHDELHQQQKAGKAFQDGWKEGPIQFLPTYKFDVGKVGVFDSSEKKRGPSWCDRILYRTRKAKLEHDEKVRIREEAKKRDEEMKAEGIEDASTDEDVLFDYDPNTDGDEYDEYDETADAEAEAVVTKEGFEDEIQLECYTAHHRVLSSDHKPLAAIFRLNYDAVLPDLKTAIHQEVARELDRAENEGRPSITLVVDKATSSESSEPVSDAKGDFDGVDFGDIRYASTKRRHITIANTGRVPATFGFKDRPAGPDQLEGPFPPWLTVEVDSEHLQVSPGSDGQRWYTLDPAEVLNVELKVKIEVVDLVRQLNAGTAKLDDILVLRVQDGRDHFLPIRGQWLQSAFARSIDKLVRIPEGGIRKLQHQKPSRDENDNGVSSNPVKWSAPRELFRLTEALEDLAERCLAEWSMVDHSANEKPPWMDNAGWPFAKSPNYFKDSEENQEALSGVHEAIDTDSPLSSAFSTSMPPIRRTEIVAEALLNFLRSLEDGVITASTWSTLEADLLTREKQKRQLQPDEERLSVLEVLTSSSPHNVSFVLLTSMLQRLASEIANASKSSADRTKSNRSSVELPPSPQVTVRRRTLSKVPEVAMRQLINRNYAAMFAEAMIRAPEGTVKEKDKKAREERMIKVVELFLGEAEEKGKK